MQKKKARISVFEKIRRMLLGTEERKVEMRKTRSYKRWENGWKRHCDSRGMIRRIGSRENAIKLGIIKK